MLYRNYPQYNFQNFMMSKVLKKPILFRNTRIFMSCLLCGAFLSFLQILNLSYRKIDENKYFKKYCDSKIDEKEITNNFISFSNYYTIDLLEEFSQY